MNFSNFEKILNGIYKPLVKFLDHDEWGGGLSTEFLVDDVVRTPLETFTSVKLSDYKF